MGLVGDTKQRRYDHFCLNDQLVGLVANEIIRCLCSAMTQAWYLQVNVRTLIAKNNRKCKSLDPTSR